MNSPVGGGTPRCARCSAQANAASRRSQWCTRFAFRPRASATPATDAPGRRHSVVTSAFNSALCLRREAPGLAAMMMSITSWNGHHPQLASAGEQAVFASCLPLASADVLRDVWHSRSGVMVVEVRDGPAFVDGQLVVPASAGLLG